MLGMQRALVHGGIRHLEKTYTSQRQTMRVHGGIRHLERLHPRKEL
ncbi:hypothetical protein ACINNAV21_1030 [Acinetobacter baumannii Naval-21]|nr:hypothetical protein ACIN5074_1088 [Acinetobacter baumannii OIFC074]EKP55003.1 hypothetical protein ACINNAV21_1030 [Acinetobacter baumannii Naval-21]KLT82345.1 hypothetical protein T632_2775 [Acinetobacter baumannii MRSN 4106]KLT88880.1 hypothetical protein T629_2917 [Acinetobacter baumannii MRSN 3405]KLU00057.1 hypothetical protein T631_2847 [Acinetobacter baumannii MRSN 3942]